MESNLCKKIFASEYSFIKRLFKRRTFHSPPQQALGLRKPREYLPRVLPLPSASPMEPQPIVQTDRLRCQITVQSATVYSCRALHASFWTQCQYDVPRRIRTTVGANRAKDQRPYILRQYKGTFRVFQQSFAVVQRKFFAKHRLSVSIVRPDFVAHRTAAARKAAHSPALPSVRNPLNSSPDPRER